MCSHMIDPISVLNKLSCPINPTIPKLRTEFDADPRTTARGLENLRVSLTLVNHDYALDPSSNSFHKIQENGIYRRR